MRLRRMFLLALVAAGAIAILRKIGRGRQAHVDVYLGDGTLTSLGEDVPEGALLLSLAREVRSAT